VFVVCSSFHANIALQFVNSVHLCKTCRAAASPGRFEPHAGPVLGLAASPFHDRLFASSGADGQLRLCSTLQARVDAVVVEWRF